MLEWLASNSAVVMALASAITGIATVFIALSSFVSWRILKWEKEKEEKIRQREEEKDRKNRQPVLVFTDEIFQAQIGSYRALQVQNVGYGPAIDIVCKILEVPEDLLYTHGEALPLGALATGQKVNDHCTTKPPFSALPIVDDPKLKAILEYDDIYANHYETTFQERKHSVGRISQRRIPWDQVKRL